VLKFKPRILEALNGYNRTIFSHDLAAGITVGFVALPLAMAFAIASGVKPEQGLITAVIAGFLISLLGGSRVQIGGPAGAFVALLYGIADRYGLQNLLIATILAGGLLFMMGALRMGGLIRFVPVAVIAGFTNGIAVLIALQQVRDLLGLKIDRMPAEFPAQLWKIEQALPSTNLWAVLVALGSLSILIVWPRWGGFLARRIPATVLVLAAGTLAVTLGDLPVETIGSRFGGIPSTLGYPVLPTIDWQAVRTLGSPALSIALLGAIESLLCARIADTMIDERHDPNQELMAQGVANMVAPLFGGIAATGTIARTVTNVRTGGRTPIAGIVHAITLALIVLLAGSLADQVPLASLAAILIFVAWNMGEWRLFGELHQFHFTYRATLLTTFVLTVAFDITIAVEAGVILSCLSFIWRITSLTQVERLALPGRWRAHTGQPIDLWRIRGALFFGSIGKLDAMAPAQSGAPHQVILDLTALLYLDATGKEALSGLQRALERGQGRLILVAPEGQPLEFMKRSGMLQTLKPENIFDTLAAALTHCAMADHDSENSL
jgi:SulP family sulfate permease